jgi:hypothetical protein
MGLLLLQHLLTPKMALAWVTLLLAYLHFQIMDVFTISGGGSKHTSWPPSFFFNNHYDMSQTIKEDALQMAFKMSLALCVSLLIAGWWLRFFNVPGNIKRNPKCVTLCDMGETFYPGLCEQIEGQRIQWELPTKYKFNKAVRPLVYGSLVWCAILILISLLGKSLHEIEECKGRLLLSSTLQGAQTNQMEGADKSNGGRLLLSSTLQGDRDSPTLAPEDGPSLERRLKHAECYNEKGKDDKICGLNGCSCSTFSELSCAVAPEPPEPEKEETKTEKQEKVVNYVVRPMCGPAETKTECEESAGLNELYVLLAVGSFVLASLFFVCGVVIFGSRYYEEWITKLRERRSAVIGLNKPSFSIRQSGQGDGPVQVEEIRTPQVKVTVFLYKQSLHPFLSCCARRAKGPTFPFGEGNEQEIASMFMSDTGN